MTNALDITDQYRSILERYRPIFKIRDKKSGQHKYPKERNEVDDDDSDVEGDFESHPGFVTATLSYFLAPIDDHSYWEQFDDDEFIDEEILCKETVGTADVSLPLHKQAGFLRGMNILQNLLAAGTLHGIFDTKLRHRSKLDKSRSLEENIESFFALCRQGLFVFDSAYAVGFLNTLPKEIAACVQSVVVTKTMTMGDEYDVRDVWSKDRNTEFTPCAKAMKENLPNLREVSFYCTEDTDWYCSHIPDDMCKLLEQGAVDIVRFLYGSEPCLTYDGWSLGWDSIRGQRILMGEEDSPPLDPQMSSEKYDELYEEWKHSPLKFNVVREEDTKDWFESIRKFGFSTVRGSWVVTRRVDSVESV
ncbi:hypothetical protein HYFRA_00006938 [Hymenoscyphus fraxineus]|uniref:Uncharacterized protein n=1 Tax=Hymenoscyphus fraxineus TaxID=746836 RepID=A0A9N9KRW0_9HELO|nr:hypothetical protein HYFRA_00006938 [Hymenoscyphus fraxineus]